MIRVNRRLEMPLTQDLMVIAARRAAIARIEATKTYGRDFKQFIPHVVQDDHGLPLELAPMHLAWVHHLEYCWAHGLKAILMAHFGSGKSSTLAVPAVAYELGRNPNLRCKLVTNDDASAKRRVGGIAHIMDSDPYKRIFPNVVRGKKWNDHELYLQRSGHALDASVQARGVMTTGIGGRADLIVFDDIVDQRNSYDPGQRRKVSELVDSTWLSRLEPDARVLYVATPWHLDDTTHHLIQRMGWCTLKQWVADDCSAIEQEVFGAGPNYLTWRA